MINGNGNGNGNEIKNDGLNVGDQLILRLVGVREIEGRAGEIVQVAVLTAWKVDSLGHEHQFCTEVNGQVLPFIWNSVAVQVKAPSNIITGVPFIPNGNKVMQ